MLSPVSNRRWTGRVRVDTLPFTYSRSLFEHGRWLFPPCLSLLPRIDTTTTPIQQGSNSLDDCSFLHHCKRFRRNESKTCARCQSTQRSLVSKLSDKKRALIWRESPPSIYFNPPPQCRSCVTTIAPSFVLTVPCKGQLSFRLFHPLSHLSALLVE